MRRRAFTSTVVAGLVAGCAGLPGGGGTPVRATEPDDDGTATEGELRYLLEQNDQDRFERLDVTRMEDRGDSLFVAYASSATDAGEFTDEVGTVGALWAVYVGNGGSATRLDVSVDPNYDDQATGFHVEAAWAEQFNADELTGQEYLNEILATLEQ